jgi:hypothetical protein
VSRFLDKWRKAQERRADEIIAEQRERAKQRDAERKAKEVACVPANVDALTHKPTSWLVGSLEVASQNQSDEAAYLHQPGISPERLGLLDSALHSEAKP